LGPFVGGYRFRRLVNATNATLLDAPAGTTLALTVPLQTMVQLQQAKADGSDVALYLGPSLLDTQWEDASMLGTNNAVLIARMPLATAPGPIPAATPLVLYSGDPLATVARSDAVFTFVERFSANVQAPPWKANTW